MGQRKQARFFDLLPEKRSENENQDSHYYTTT